MEVALKLLAFSLVFFVLFGIPTWIICSRTGLNPAWSLLAVAYGLAAGWLQSMNLQGLAVLLVIPFIFPYSHVFWKAGYSRWRALILLVPLFNIVSLWTFAFRKWPGREVQPFHSPSEEPQPVDQQTSPRLGHVRYASHSDHSELHNEPSHYQNRT
jgi:hypothetical protein